MLVSFIIPAYNAADTIVRCLESIYGLSLKREEFEVIVIDDASTDNTVSVIEDWRKSIDDRWIDDRLTILRQPENRRQGAARNRGVIVAKGEYICFVDSDDMVTKGIVNAILLAKEKQTDMLPYHLAYADERGTITREEVHLSFDEGQIFSGIAMQNKHPYWLSGPVAYIYNKEFLERMDYPFAEGVLFEDSDFVVVHLYHAKRMTYSKELGYVAYERPGSTTRSMTFKSVADYLLLGVRMMRFYESIMSEGVNELTNERLKFAEGILEGACWNIERAFHYMPRLSSRNERKACYARIDAHADRSVLLANPSLRKYFWRRWTKMGLSSPWLMMRLSAIVAPMYIIKNKIRKIAL